MTSSEKTRSVLQAKQRPFPWRCLECGKREVEPLTTQYTAEVKHDGRLYTIDVPKLEIPTCKSCGEKVFTNSVDDQISEALRGHLRLLTPQQIQGAIRALGMSQKAVAEHLGIAEATLSRWLNGVLIQSRALDNLLRVYFESSAVREMLPGAGQDPKLGTALCTAATR